MKRAATTIVAAVLVAFCIAGLLRAQQSNFPQVMPADTVYGAQFTSGPGVAIPFNVLAQRLLNTQVAGVTGTPQVGWIPVATSQTTATWQLLRLKLSAPLTLFADFVNGNDSNDCLAAGISRACKTVQAAYNKLVSNYDTAGQNVTIHFVANDSCLSMVSPWVGGGTLAVTGTGSSVGLSCPGGAAVNVSTTLPGALLLNNMTLSGAFGVFINSPALVQIRAGITCGANTSACIFSAASGATTVCTNVNGGSGGIGYSINGGGYAHIIVESGTVNCSNLTVTLTGAPAFSVFAQADNSGSSLLAANNTYSGSASGSRYLITANASISTLGGGANYFPGNSPGNTSTGGQYQ